MDGLSDAGSIPARSTPERETAMQSLFFVQKRESNGEGGVRRNDTKM